MKSRRLLLVAIVAALVAGGCTSGRAGQLNETQTNKPATDVSQAPTSTATPLPPYEFAPLEPGTYILDKTTVPPEHSEAFDSVRITFTVPGGWEAWYLGVLKDHPAGAPATVAGENGLGVLFWKVGGVPADPCYWQRGGPRVGPTVDDLATALANQSRRQATTPTDVTLDGYSGKHLRLTVPTHIEFSGDDVFPTCDQGYFVSWGSPTSRFGRYNQGPGQVDELWILDVHGFRLVIDAAYWRNTPERYVAEVRRIVDSVRIERG